MGASVVLRRKAERTNWKRKRMQKGDLVFTVRHEGMYTVTVEKRLRQVRHGPDALSTGQKKKIELRLQTATAAQPSSSSGTASSDAMEFKDEPNFTVAGVTDWSGAGGHGSDTSLRTSEAFARETLALKSSGADETLHGAAAEDVPGRETAETETNCAPLSCGLLTASKRIISSASFGLRSGKYREAISSLKARTRLTANHRSCQRHDLAAGRTGHATRSSADWRKSRR